MPAKTTSERPTEPVDLPTFSFQQIVVGLELGETDAALLTYLDYFSGQIPVAAASFYHVAPRFDLVLDSEILNEKYQLDQAIHQRVAGTVASHLTSDRILSVKQIVREGSPLEELLRGAEAERAELIAIGQKSLADHHAILAKKLARRADCDLLIVPSAAKPRMGKILVPIDFSNHAAQALQTAVAMNRQLAQPAEIVGLHVYELPDFSAYNIGKTEEQFHRMVERDRRQALAAFVDTHVPEPDRKYVRPELLLKARPRVARYVLDFARTQDIDFIIMGARGHSRIHLLFVGSVTESVLSENKTIPTLIIR